MKPLRCARPVACRPVVRGLTVLVLVLGSGVARADLRFGETRVNLGEVWTGRPLAHRFGFVNEGPETVEIAVTKVGCGCLSPRLDRRVYPPGTRGELMLEVHTLSQALGPHTWSVEVGYRCGNQQHQKTLTLSGRVVSEVSVEPAAVTVVADGVARHEITVTDTRPKPLAVTAVRSSSSKLTGRLGEEGRDAAGNWYRKVGIEVADDCPEGRQEEFLVLSTNDQVYPDLKILVTVHKRPRERVAAFPDQVKLTAAPMAALPSQMVRLRDQDGQAVVVERIEAGDPAITCRWAAGPDTMATLRLTVDGKRVSPAGLKSAVHVHLSKPVPAVLTIPVLVVGP
jgi:hypothetical protein